jgi:hypothetical protein
MDEFDETWLYEKYGGKFVARRDKEVIASAETFDEVLAAIDQLDEDTAGITIEFVPSPDHIYVF